MLGQNPDEVIHDELTKLSQTLVDRIRENLVSKDQWFDQSTLAQSIIALPIEQVAGGYMLSIQMPSYAKFVDSGRGKGSVGGEGIRRLQEWVSRRGIPTPLRIKVAVKTKRGMKFYNRSFKNTIEARNAIAWGAAMNIKKRGYISKGQGFYSEVLDSETLGELFRAMIPQLGEAYTAEIVSE